MPFPSNLEAMLSAGYEYVRAETCRECRMEVEVYLTPGKRELLMEPMPGNESLAVRHLEVCNPLPASKDELLKVGYTLAKRIPCPVCKRAIEEYSHTSRETLFLNPMMGGDWPVVPHRCNIAPKQEPPSAPRSGPWHAVTDPNGQLLGVKYDPVGGIFRCRWRKGEGFHTGVPEEIFVTIQRVPFAYSYYQKRVKGQFPYTKVE